METGELPTCAHCGEELDDADDWSELISPGADERVLVRLHEACYEQYVLSLGVGELHSE